MPSTALPGVEPESSWCWKADAGSGCWRGALSTEPAFGPFHRSDMHPPTAPFQLPVTRCVGHCHQLWPRWKSACHYWMSRGGSRRLVQVPLSLLEKASYCCHLGHWERWGWLGREEEESRSSCCGESRALVPSKPLEEAKLLLIIESTHDTMGSQREFDLLVIKYGETCIVIAHTDWCFWVNGRSGCQAVSFYEP